MFTVRNYKYKGKRLPQSNKDISPEKEKESAKRKKIAEMNAVTAQAILGSILNQLGSKYEQYHFRKYCVMIIPIGDGGIEVRMSNSNIIKQRKAVQEKLAKLFDFISGGASLENITFGGTREQWEKIEKEQGWNNDMPAKAVHCTDGDVEIQ